MSLSSFCVVHLLVGMEPALNSGLYAQWDSLEVVFQSKLTSVLGTGGELCPLHLSALGPYLAQSCASPMLATMVSVSSYVFFCVSMTLLTQYPLSASSSYRVPWGLRRVICGRHPSFLIENSFSIQWTQSIKLICIYIHLIMSIKWNSIIALNFH